MLKFKRAFSLFLAVIFMFGAVAVSSAEEETIIKISAQPSDKTVTAGSISGNLSVEAALEDYDPNTVVPGKVKDFPAPATLQSQIMPPDLLTMFDGVTPVKSEAQWAERQKEIRAMLEFYMYGPAYIESDDYKGYTLGGNGTSRTLTVNVGKGSINSVLGGMSVQLPEGEPPESGWPVFLGSFNHGAYARSMGYATINVPAYSITTSAPFYTLYPYSTSSWQTRSGYAAAFAWNVARVIDALEDGAGSELGINPAKTIVTGTSRNGKYAAAAGALDERVWVTMPVASGMGGVNMGRFNSNGTEWNMYTGPASLLNAPNAPWNEAANPKGAGWWGPIGTRESWGNQVSNNFFGGNASSITDYNHAPVDAHFVAAASAGKDRYTFMVTGINSERTNGVPGIQYTYDLAVEVYKLLGIEDNLAMQIHTVTHGTDPESMVKMFAYLDHMQGNHGKSCTDSCDMDKYLYSSGTTPNSGLETRDMQNNIIISSAEVVSYFTNWQFTMGSLKTTPFKSSENAETYAKCLPGYIATCNTCKKPETECICVPEIADCILIDFETPETSGMPRSGIGWAAPAGGGTVTNGVLTASSANWSAGSVFTINLGDSKLGDYEKISLDFMSNSTNSENKISIYAYTGSAAVSGGWLGDVNDNYLGEIAGVTASTTMKSHILNISSVPAGLKNLTGTIKLVIGRNAQGTVDAPHQYSMDNIKLTAVSCDEDCAICSGAVVYPSITTNQTQTFREYAYEFWSETVPTGTTSMTLKGDNGIGEGKVGGAFDTVWSGTLNFLARSGKRYSQTNGNVIGGSTLAKTHTELGDISIDFAGTATWNINDGAPFLSVYGWVIPTASSGLNDLVEYYIIQYRGRGVKPWGIGSPLGSAVIDGETYDFYVSTRPVGSGSIQGNNIEFKQYWSVPRNKSNDRNSGIISVSEHFDAWEAAGMPMDGILYEVTMKVETYVGTGNGTGSASVTKNLLTITPPGQSSSSFSAFVPLQSEITDPISYQWYSNTVNSNTGGTLIAGATSKNFTIPTTLKAGTYYYYAVLSAEGAISDVTTRAAKVTVNSSGGSTSPGTGSGTGSPGGGGGSTTNTTTTNAETASVTAKQAEIAAAAAKGNGTEVKIPMTAGSTSVSKEALTAIASKDTNLVLDFGMYQVTLNGKDVTTAMAAADMNVAVQKGAMNTSSALPTQTLKIGSGITVNIAGTVTTNIGVESAGQNAILAIYNEATKKYEFVSGGTIAANGTTKLSFKKTGDYVVIVRQTGDITGTGKVETTDALELLKAIVGTVKLDPMQEFVANSKHTEISTTDALNILKFVVGSINKL